MSVGSWGRVEGCDHRPHLTRRLRRLRGDKGVEGEAVVARGNDDDALRRPALRAGKGVDERACAVQRHELRADLAEVGEVPAQAALDPGGDVIERGRQRGTCGHYESAMAVG